MAITLANKIGIKPGMKISFVNAPDSFFDIIDFPREIMIEEIGHGEPKDYIHAFFLQRENLQREIFYLKNRLQRNGMLWISWPKGTSSVTTDINREIVREEVLGEGLVDVKVCSVDQTWSALKFVYRLKDRKKNA